MSTKWYEVKEKSHVGLGYKIMLLLLKMTPAVFMRLVAFPVGFFYWIFSQKERNFSRVFLDTINSLDAQQNFTRKKKLSTLKHFISFALNLVENVQSWGGKFSFDDVNWQNDDVHDLVKNINEGKGTLIVISHLGNAQMLKGLASMGQSGTEQKMSITTISDAKISKGFNALLNEVNSDSSFNLISTDNIGPETILILQERLEKGELVVIAGDRVSAHTDRNLLIDFLDKKANLPYGVFLLIALLNVPTYFVNGLRQKDFSVHPKYDMFVKKNPIQFDCTRKEREQRILQSAKNYAKNLEILAKVHPYQWYNFFDFWE